uniref:Uncharacterized protein n=1 Tax=Anopheles atroparvus TaxID=41427 RepID=A0A182J807_ANOAO
MLLVSWQRVTRSIINYYQRPHQMYVQSNKKEIKTYPHYNKEPTEAARGAPSGFTSAPPIATSSPLRDDHKMVVIWAEPDAKLLPASPIRFSRCCCAGDASDRVAVLRRARGTSGRSRYNTTATSAGPSGADVWVECECATEIEVVIANGPSSFRRLSSESYSGNSQHRMNLSARGTSP